jgi:hypothetical protein
MGGENVKVWTRAQIVAMNDRVNGGMPTTDEQHWTLFYNDFQNTWKDDTLQENSLLKLSQLSMGKDIQINHYIATFNALTTKLGWARNHHGTVSSPGSQ